MYKIQKHYRLPKVTIILLQSELNSIVYPFHSLLWCCSQVITSRTILTVVTLRDSVKVNLVAFEFFNELSSLYISIVRLSMWKRAVSCIETRLAFRYSELPTNSLSI